MRPLDLAHDLVALQDRLVAAGMDHDLRLLGLDLGEELDPAAERGVGPPAADDQGDARQPSPAAAQRMSTASSRT